MRKGLVFVICAPSGAGKSTLARMLLEEFPELKFSVSCTTRKPRENEKDGQDYWFIDTNQFEQLILEDSFLEWAKVHGNYYGTSKKQVCEILEKGENVLLDIDAQGAAQIKLALPEAKFVFILPPSMLELEKRLRKRALDDEAAIRKRLENAKTEIGQAGWFDALVVNDSLEKAYDRLRSTYIAAALSPSRNSLLLNALLLEK